MLFSNCSFTTYRQTASSGNYAYSGTATITNGAGYIEPLDGQLKATLNIDNATEAYQLLTEEMDFQVRDKVSLTIPSFSGDRTANYYVSEREEIFRNSMRLSLLILKKAESV